MNGCCTCVPVPALSQWDPRVGDEVADVVSVGVPWAAISTTNQLDLCSLSSR